MYGIEEAHIILLYIACNLLEIWFGMIYYASIDYVYTAELLICLWFWKFLEQKTIAPKLLKSKFLPSNNVYKFLRQHF